MTPTGLLALPRSRVILVLILAALTAALVTLLALRQVHAAAMVHAHIALMRPLMHYYE